MLIFELLYRSKYLSIISYIYEKIDKNRKSVIIKKG